MLLGSFTMWLLFSCWIQLSYASNLPKVPDEKVGRIYRMEVNHGSVRYGSEREIQTLKWTENCQMITMVFFLIALVLRVKYDDFRKNDKKPKGVPRRL